VPPLIVCGSAHTTTKRPGGARYRANESVVLLRGREILRHEKTHAFRTRYLGAKMRLEKKIPEGITPGPKTLTIGCGDATRLAIVICADLNDQLIPPLLAESGANLVLVPALTAQSGAFIGSCLYVASQNQGIAVVANGTPDLPEGYPVPFLALVALPTSSNGADEYTPSSGQRRAIGLVDPGAAGDNIVSWH
jgi:predicted amidohydrolase